MASFLILRRGQIALWIILAVALVGALLLFFAIEQDVFEPTEQTFSARAFIDSCVRDAVYEAESIILPQGGFVEPTNYKLYRQTRVTYLCDNVGYFKTCINQHPLLLNEMQRELLGTITPVIDTCFTDLQNALERRGATVNYGSRNVSVELAPRTITVTIDQDTSITQRESSERIEQFVSLIHSPFYDLGTVAQDIAAQESQYCYFEYVGYSLLYPWVDIQKTTLADATKIYTLRDTRSQKEMAIATRSCAIPPGI